MEMLNWLWSHHRVKSWLRHAESRFSSSSCTTTKKDLEISADGDVIETKSGNLQRAKAGHKASDKLVRVKDE